MLHVASRRIGVFRACTNIACVAGGIVVPGPGTTSGVTFLAAELQSCHMKQEQQCRKGFSLATKEKFDLLPLFTAQKTTALTC